MTTAPQLAPEVRTTAGRVRGRHEDGLAVFRGIPFAEPPVGPLRFAAPRPAAGWDGVREATAFGPPPPQAPGQELDAARIPETATGWLTVNVWSPRAEPGAGLAVLVWIYGGAYRFGEAADPTYDGARLAREGGVVVVSFNHRVGVEGFGQLAGAPANRGLLDQVAALEWVRDNIAAFGGDPGAVTVFGESAGAGGVAALLAMPAAAGLFGRAIAQSVPGTFFSPELADDVMATIAGRISRAPTAADLADVSPSVLVAASNQVSAAMAGHAARWGAVARTPTPFSPVVDGEVLPRTPWAALADGAGSGIELLVGHNRDEFRLFTVMSGRAGQITAADADAALAAFAPDPDAYRRAFPDATAEQLHDQVQSDWLFRMPSHRLAEAQVAGGGRAHAYELVWAAPGSGGLLGAAHGLDVPLVFGNLASGTLTALFLGPDTAGAEVVSGLFRRAWTAFATTGDPGWPAYDTARRLVGLFDSTLTSDRYPEETSRELWAEHEFAPLPLLGG
jgi:para-nitrobenzyl esterase